MGTYKVLVTIQNKPEISDPEGSTILNDLVLRSGTDDITEITFFCECREFTGSYGEGKTNL